MRAKLYLCHVLRIICDTWCIVRFNAIPYYKTEYNRIILKINTKYHKLYFYNNIVFCLQLSFNHFNLHESLLIVKVIKYTIVVFENFVFFEINVTNINTGLLNFINLKSTSNITKKYEFESFELPIFEDENKLTINNDNIIKNNKNSKVNHNTLKCCNL